MRCEEEGERLGPFAYCYCLWLPWQWTIKEDEMTAQLMSEQVTTHTARVSIHVSISKRTIKPLILWRGIKEHSAAFLFNHTRIQPI